jgi:DNA-binding NarL/FixJ family response regulator
MKLLVIAANPLVRRMLRAVVAETASYLCECSTYEEAVATYGGYRPDFVLIDPRFRIAFRLRQAFGLPIRRRVWSCWQTMIMPTCGLPLSVRGLTGIY